MPALVSGFHLVYQVDERAVTAQPVDALSIALPPLDPGVHELRVVLLDAQGRELARSPTSSFEVGRTTMARNAPKRECRTKIVQFRCRHVAWTPFSHSLHISLASPMQLGMRSHVTANDLQGLKRVVGGKEG